jgi:serine/threonine-protein kinase
VDGLRNILGFTHFATHDKRFAPEFLIKIVGDELVVTVDESVIHRTELDLPVFNVHFEDAIRSIFLRGLRRLIDSPVELPAGRQFFGSDPHESLSSARDALIYSPTAAS